MTDTPPLPPYERYLAAYSADAPPPWDSGIVPPEVRALVEGDSPLPPGRAFDAGCGTGVSSVYLASHGWQVTGSDWIEAALEKARARAAQAGLSEEQVRFVRADLTAPDALPDHPPVSLWLDVGCVHGFSPEARAVYAAHATRLVAPGGILLIYAWGRHERDGHLAGLDQEDAAAAFAPAFTLVHADHGQEATNTAVPAAWYTLRRV